MTPVCWPTNCSAKRIEGAAPMLVGRDNIHNVKDGGSGVLPSPVSVVISTRIKPSQESAYRAWEQRTAAVQSNFQSYRFDPPVRPACAAIGSPSCASIRKPTSQAWLDPPERQKLLREATSFTEEFHARIARTGLDRWFPSPPAERHRHRSGS